MNELDTTQQVFLDFLQEFKCVHNIIVYPGTISILCSTKLGIVLYNIYDFNEYSKVICQIVIDDVPLEALEKECDSTVLAYKELIDEITYLDNLDEKSFIVKLLNGKSDSL